MRSDSVERFLWIQQREITHFNSNHKTIKIYDETGVGKKGNIFFKTRKDSKSQDKCIN